MKTARYLALPAAVALHTLGAILISLLIWAVVARSTSPGALAGGLSVLNYTLAAAVGVLAVLGLAQTLRDRRAGPAGQAGGTDRTVRTARTVSSVALATALILQAVRAFIPIGVVDRAIGFESYNALVQTLSGAGLLLAAVAVVAGAVAARRAPRGPGSVARILVAVAPPAALLLWSLVPLLATVTAVSTVVSSAGAALSLVGLGAAVVLLRRSRGDAPEVHRSVDGTPLPGVAGDATSAMEGTGRRFLRHLATPLGLACLALVLPLLDVVETGQGAWLPLVFAVVLAIAAVAGAVLDFRALGGTRVPRAGPLVGELGVPASILVIPVALLFGGLAGGGWAMLGALVIGLLVAALVALVGLIGALISAFSGRYASRPARSSVIATALVFVAAATFIPFQPSGASLVSVIATAILLLVALGCGLAAVLSPRPTLRLPEPTEPLSTETADAGVNAVPNPYR
ncbi:hypothetical protein F7P69_20080 [Cellulosimicrobium funkei]|nr:hypothetical protein [Cellulosimicrobium funkei]